MSANPWLQLDAFREAARAKARTTLVFHLPGVLKDSKYAGQARLVSACGRTGPIRARMTLAVQGEAFEIPGCVVVSVCPGCEVAWDKAESAGGVLEMFSTNGNRVWGSGGAYLFYKEPTRRAPHQWKAKGQPSRKLLVVVRTETAPRVRP